MQSIAQQAEGLLDSLFEPIGNATKYIRAFRTSRGRELAIERNRGSIFVWTEDTAASPRALPSPRRYDATKSRNSNLRANAPRLKQGNVALYWNLSSTAELEQLCDWYATA